MDVGSSDSEEEDQRTDRPYNELLQLLQPTTDSKRPARKKRKIEHKEKSRDEEPVPEVDEEEGAEDNALEAQVPSDDEDEENIEDDAGDDKDDSDDEDGNIPTCLVVVRKLTSQPPILSNPISLAQLRTNCLRRLRSWSKIIGMWSRRRLPVACD